MRKKSGGAHAFSNLHSFTKLFVTLHNQSLGNKLSEVQAVQGKDVVKDDLPEVHCIEYAPDSA